MLVHSPDVPGTIFEGTEFTCDAQRWCVVSMIQYGPGKLRRGDMTGIRKSDRQKTEMIEAGLKRSGTCFVEADAKVPGAIESRKWV